MPSRRAYLAGFGAALAGSAGCLGEPASNGDPNTEHTTDTTATTRTPTTTESPPLDWGGRAEVGNATVTPEETAVRRSAFHFVAPDTVGVTDFDGGQALFVTVATSGTAPEPAAFELAVPGGSGGWVEPPGGEWLYRTTVKSPYDGGNGWLGFAAPAPVDAAGSELRVEHGSETASWPLPASVRTALGEPVPSFTVDSISVPDAVSAGESFDVSLTVRNNGETSGTFRAAVNETGPSYIPHRISIALEPGATETWTRTFVAEKDDSELGFEVRTADAAKSYTVDVR